MAWRMVDSTTVGRVGGLRESGGVMAVCRICKVFLAMLSELAGSLKFKKYYGMI